MVSRYSKKLRFSLKVHRLITHFKKLKDCFQEFFQFFNLAQKGLKRKLKILLFQFPRSFKFSEENYFYLNNFIITLRKEIQLPFAFEFRHLSWENEKITELFKKYKVCFVWSDSAVYPKFQKVTTDFLYFRFHGPRELFASSYSLKELKEVALKIKKDFKNLDCYIYFNNDFYGYAISDALTLKKLLKIKT